MVVQPFMVQSYVFSLLYHVFIIKMCRVEDFFALIGFVLYKFCLPLHAQM